MNRDYVGDVLGLSLTVWYDDVTDHLSLLWSRLSDALGR